MKDDQFVFISDVSPQQIKQEMKTSSIQEMAMWASIVVCMFLLEAYLINP